MQSRSSAVGSGYTYSHDNVNRQLQGVRYTKGGGKPNPEYHPEPHELQAAVSNGPGDKSFVILDLSPRGHQQLLADRGKIGIASESFVKVNAAAQVETAVPTGSGTGTHKQEGVHLPKPLEARANAAKRHVSAQEATELANSVGSRVNERR